MDLIYVLRTFQVLLWTFKNAHYSKCKLNVFIVLREAPPLKHFLGHILGQIY